MIKFKQISAGLIAVNIFLTAIAFAVKAPVNVKAYRASDFAADFNSVDDDKCITGKWHGSFGDCPNAMLSLNNNGKFNISFNGKKESGKWDLKKGKLTLMVNSDDSKDEVYSYIYDRARDMICIDEKDGDGVFNRVSDLTDDDEISEVNVEAHKEDFIGSWNVIMIENTHGAVSSYPDTLKTAKIILTVDKDMKMTIDIQDESKSESVKISDIATDFTIGALTFFMANPITSSVIEAGKGAAGKVFLHESDLQETGSKMKSSMLSLTIVDGDNKTTLYAEKINK